MSFQDKSLQCFDCGTIFTFSIAEQEQFASLGYSNDPKRCPSCRRERKARQNIDSLGGNNNSYSYKSVREMFPAVCSECGKATQVPFQPCEDRPVYCSDCYNKVRLSRSRQFALEVIPVIIMNDKYIGSGQLRGYDFIEMASKADGEATIANLNKKTLKHMTISVVEALPLSDHKDKGFLYIRRPSHFSGRVGGRSY